MNHRLLDLFAENYTVGMARMVCLFRLLLLVSLITPFPAAAANAATRDDIQLLREFGEEETVIDAISYHGNVYFFVEGDNAISLWKTGGDSENTLLVKRIEGESAWRENIFTHRNSTSLPREKRGEPILINDNFYFFTRVNASWAQYLWQSDGTPEGTTRVAPLPKRSYLQDDAYLMNGILYFLDSSCLWRTDGTSAGTWQVSAEFRFAGSLIIYNNHLYFSAFDDVHAQELWVSDGTPAGTRLFADLNPIEDSLCLPPDDEGAAPNSAYCDSSSYPGYFAISGNELYFSAFSPLIGMGLWKTNGNGVRLVKNFPPGNSYYGYANHPSPFTLPDGTLLICADDGVHGWELWISDGTTTGTTLLKDIFPGAGDGISCYDNLGVLNNSLFFSGNDGVHGESLWKTDGTAAGTVPVRHFSGVNHDVRHSSFDNTVWDGRLYFDVSGQFWATDGTGSGTTMLAETLYASFPSDYSDVNSVIFNNRLILAAGDLSAPDLEDIELWATDGTKAGTKLIRDLLPGVDRDFGWEISSEPEFFFAKDNALLFFAGSSSYYDDNDYLCSRTGLFSLTTRPLITLPWLKPLLLHDH